ncbi:MAG: hypothetical protein AAGG01_20665 [Planctomycetota bacterium]
MNTTLAKLTCAALGAGSLIIGSVQEPAPEKPLATGDKAPLFSLNDAGGQLVSQVAEPETWTVLAFYPKALTGG